MEAKVKGYLIYVCFISYRDCELQDSAIYHICQSLSEQSGCCVNNASRCECYFHHYYSNRCSFDLTTASFGLLRVQPLQSYF